MGTTNQYQSKLRQMNYSVLLNQVVYMPKLLGLGTGQGAWKPVPYANSSRDVLRITMDDLQLQKNTLSDNVFRRIGITSTTEKISIQPLVLEMVESGFAERNINDVIPMVITELNKIFDKLNAEKLKAVAKSGTAFSTQTCVAALVNDLIRIVSEHPYEMKKHVIIPQKAYIALNSISGFDESVNWMVDAKSRLQSLNATLRVCAFMGDVIYVVLEPLLAEYQGEVPQILGDGFDERSREYWIHFLLSNSDFKPRMLDAVTSYALTLDLTKISDFTCPQKKT